MVVYVPLMFVCAIPLCDPEGTPAIVTLADVLCIPWFLWWTVITAELVVVVRGFCLKVFTGTISLTREIVPVVFSVNEARLILNLTSSFCSAVHVLPFWDLNIDPKNGCLEINLLSSKVFCPILAVYIL